MTDIPLRMASAMIRLATARVACAAGVLALLLATIPGHGQAQQTYDADSGPLVLRPQGPMAASPGISITGTGSVIVNLDAIGRPGSRSGFQAGPSAPTYFNRPPLPGEVPLMDEDPIILRPPTAVMASQQPAVERRSLPEPDQATARPTPPRPLPPQAPAEPRVAAPSPPQTPAPAPVTTATATPRPALRSQVRTQPDPQPTAGSQADAQQAPSASPPAGTTEPSQPAASSVTLPATSAPARTVVPEPPSRPTAATATAPAPAVGTAPQTEIPPQVPAAAQQVARADAPERTLPAVPQGDSQAVIIPFAGDSAALDSAAEQQLAALANRLKDSSDRLQIKAYAQAPDSGSASGARRLSLSRALSVRSYLIDKGIRSTRIDVRALGDSGEGQLDRVDISISDRQ